MQLRLGTVMHSYTVYHTIQFKSVAYLVTIDSILKIVNPDRFWSRII